MRSKLCEFIVVPRNEIEKFIKRCDAVLLGPGMGINNETREITNHLLKKYPNKKFVLDADALKVLDLKLLSLRAKRNSSVHVRDHHNLRFYDDSRCILTPHAVEFQTLFKIKATPKNVAKMAKKYNCIIVLKGAVDIICGSWINGDGAFCFSVANKSLLGRRTQICADNFICKFDYAGNAGLTKGGTGDVLAGLIAALACKNDLFLAACAGTFLLGKSGERLFQKYSYYYNPSDLIAEIPKTIKWCEEF
jgi:NAD(P)H-hydrate epimerase